jgi:hypothetical protein
LAWISPAFTGDSYDLAFSTYFGGSQWEHARDVCADARGNVYVCGGTASHDFPTTPGAYDRTFNSGDTSGQECDAFICKFGPDGRLIWSTYLGSPGYDRAYGIEVDAQGYVYVAGRAGRGFPVTPGAFQPAFQGYNGGGYGGFQNGFVAKLAPARTITLDPGRTYQTISGWEAVAFALESTDPAFPNFKDTLFDQAVNDLGVNHVRLEVRSGVENTDDNWTAYQAGAIDYQTWRSRRYATVNDNADPQTLNSSGYHFSEMDNAIDRIGGTLTGAARLGRAHTSQMAQRRIVLLFRKATAPSPQRTSGKTAGAGMTTSRRSYSAPPLPPHPGTIPPPHRDMS